MQNLTLSPQSRPGWAFWRNLLLLLALLAGLSSPNSVWGQRFNSDNITINAITTAASSTTIYNGKTPTTSNGVPLFTGSDLGKGSKFDLTSGNLSVTGIAANVAAGGTDPGVTSVTLFYRVYPFSATVTPTSPAFITATLSTSADPTKNSIPFTYSGSPINLLNQPTVLGGGLYSVEIYYQLNYDDSNSPDGSGGFNGSGVVTDPGNNSSGGYKATFMVLAPPTTPNGGTTTWISNSSTTDGTNWFNSSNWDNGVPTRNSNAIIPDKTVDTSTPLLDDPNATYEVRTLTLQGLTNSSRALLRIGQSVSGGGQVGASLHVYGDLNAFAGGILAAVSGTNGSPNPLTNSTLVLSRNDGGAQAVRGSKLSIVDIKIEGRGLKAIVATELAAPNTFSFTPDPTGPGAIVRTAGDNAAKGTNGIPDDNAPDSAFPLNTTQSSSVNLKDSGFINGETTNSYVEGILIADRSLSANIKQTFGNIGFDITPNRNIPSPNVVVTRTVGDPLRGPVATTGPPKPSAPGSPQPVKRQYGISGDVNNNTTSTIVFHYLNSTDELNGIPEVNLTIFKTGNNAPPFTPVGRTGDVDLVNHTVTRADYNGSLNTITLGDQLNPLPVVLASFTAARSGANALITWKTATETNSKGFEVQVSTDGTAFRTLGFVSSETPNSIQAKNYKYVDTENGKFGTRYYRLHQVDLDGKDSYSPTRAVNFDGAATGAVALSVYPNPFLDTDKVSLNFGSNVANGVAQVQLIDMVGRTVRQQNLTISNASLELGDLNDLHSGMYLARITLPDGSTQSVRLQKK